MYKNEILKKIDELKELEELANEVNAQMESIKDEIKEIMVELETEELEVGTHIVRWTKTLSNRFDTTNFKKNLPDLYKAYTKQVASRRFSIA